MKRRKQADWMKHVKVGDVLEMPSGLQRIVRHVSFFDNGDLRSASFAIKRCSWTRRAYTTYNFTDLLPWTFVMARDLPASKADKKLANDLRWSRRHSQKMDCCEGLCLP